MKQEQYLFNIEHILDFARQAVFIKNLRSKGCQNLNGLKKQTLPVLTAKQKNGRFLTKHSGIFSKFNASNPLDIVEGPYTNFRFGKFLDTYRSFPIGVLCQFIGA